MNTPANELFSNDTTRVHGLEIQVTTFHNCITGLKQYENKSLEELRWEDYLLNRKYPARPPPPISQLRAIPIATSSSLHSIPSSLNAFRNEAINISNSGFDFSTQVVNMNLNPLLPFSFLYNNLNNANNSASRFNFINPTRNQSLNNGTKLIKYKSTPGSDFKQLASKDLIPIDTSYTSISMMHEYEQKSFEELRHEDYLNGLKHPPIRPIAVPKVRHDKTPSKSIQIQSQIKSQLSDDSENESSCPICLESIIKLKKQNVRLMVTTCGHVICKPCATRLIETSKKNRNKLIECPTCRNKLNENSIHDLFL